MIKGIRCLIEPPSLNKCRKDALRDAFIVDNKRIFVDTYNSTDYGWGTGISIDEGNFVIVEEYFDKEKAYKGHKRWVKKMQRNPHRELKECRDVLEWFFGE